jgi:hypothetical protein
MSFGRVSVSSFPDAVNLVIVDKAGRFLDLYALLKNEKGTSLVDALTEYCEYDMFGIVGNFRIKTAANDN